MDVIREFFRHNTMMNERIVDACRGLADEQLAATVEGTYGTVGATLVHIANSQVSYATSFTGDDRPERLPEDPFPGFDPIDERFALGNGALEAVAAQADDDGTITVTGDDPVGTWAMPRVLLLIQAINHATEHRSQIATILTQIGIEPPSMDGWTFFFDAGHMAEV